MELKELRCKNCGAKIEVNEGTRMVTCKYCNTTFSTDDDYSAGYEYTKGVLKAQEEQLEKNMELFYKGPIFKFEKIVRNLIFIFAGIIIIAIWGFLIVSIFNDITNN